VYLQEEPRDNGDQQNRIPKENIIVGAIIGGCVGITSWHYLTVNNAKKGARTALLSLREFRKRMVLSWRNINDGRYYTLLTSTFTHVSSMHLLVNMMALWGFGRMSIGVFGVPQFAVLWVGSALVGGAAELYQHRKRGIDQDCIGASGSLFGISAALACAMPRLGVNFIFIPMNLGTAMAISVIGSMACIEFGWLPALGHADHLGGMAFGALWWYIKLRRGRT
jgi:membrane associated rhomboid family serine protease